MSVSAAQYEIVARVGKARGLEGKVTASVAADLPFCLYEGLRVHVVPPTLWGPRDITVSSVEESGRGGLVLGFEEIADRDDAEQVAGRCLLADVADLDLDPGEAEDLRSCIGCRVQDERYGDLGKVSEIIETPANDVLVVQGDYGEVLVPVIEEVLVKVPEEDGLSIRTRIMDGLIEGDPDGGVEA